MTASLFTTDSDPTSALPALEDILPPADPQTNGHGTNGLHDESGSESGSESEYLAPLSASLAHMTAVSIDGTSVGSIGGGIRAEKLEDVDAEDKAEALRIKSEANALFTTSKYRPSLDLYTASLNKNPFDAAVWSNRAAVRLKLEEYGLAIADATRAIELDDRFVKAYFRRASANLAIMKPKAAITDLKKVLQLDKNNAPAKLQLDSTQKLLRKLLFEAAISGKDAIATSVKILDQLTSGSSPIESDYTGPLVPADGKPTLEFVESLIEWFKSGKLIPRRVAWEIVLGAHKILKNEPTLVDVDIPEGQTINIIGDTHGQFFDFLHLLSLTGSPSPTHTLLFNGDFVDRGNWGSEIVLVLFAFKWLYPRNLFLNRGNHETADMNKVYGFEGETKKKYSELTYKLFEEVFTCLPLATLITASTPPRANAAPNPRNPTLCNGRKRFFVVHGGLFSREDVLLSEIKSIDRMKQAQPGTVGLMVEMLWTDPQDAEGRGPSKRGVGIGFGPDVTRRWTQLNEVTAVIRSHEVRQGGYSVEHDGLLMTVFSAPNYVDQVGNLAAFATIEADGELEFTTFREQPHPAIQAMAYAPGGFA